MFFVINLRDLLQFVAAMQKLQLGKMVSLLHNRLKIISSRWLEGSLRILQIVLFCCFSRIAEYLFFRKPKA